jgi:DNA repair exonuclease SbcCD ATPase subunit
MKNNIPIYNKNNGKLRELIVQLLHTKKNTTKSKNLVNIVHNVINKESIIIQLRNEFTYINQLNEQYKIYLEKLKKIVKKIQQNKKEVESLSHILLENYKDDVIVINNYEKKLKLISMDSGDVSQLNEDELNKKKKITKSLQSKLKDVESKISLNVKEIEKQKNLMITISSQIEEEKKELIKREKTQLSKFDKLKQKYSYYQKQIKIVKDKIKTFEQKNKKHEEVEIENEDLANQLLKKEDKECELNERIIENQNLNYNFKTLSAEFSKLTLKINEMNNNIENTENKLNENNHTIECKTSRNNRGNSPTIIKSKRYIRI